MHAEFLKLNPENSVSLSKFASLRPRECVLAGSSGMHNVCVCTIHENVQLMFDAAHLKSIDGLNSITDCLKLLTCADPSPDCHLRECKKCPDSGELREKLQVLFDEEMVDSVTFNQWESADRCNIFTKSSPTEDFIDDFTDKVEALVTLHFIFKEQVSFLNQLKQDLELNEMIVV